MIPTMRQFTHNLVVRLQFDVDTAREYERQMIDSACVEHTSLPDHYWQNRHRLECRLEAAVKLLESLSEPT
jgi:hypothetical protein